MSVSRLALTDFRSYPQALVEPGDGFVVLTGENGAGKTNILEAVSLLAPGRGLRRAKLSEMARQGGPGGFAVAVRAVAEGGEIEIGTGASPQAPERRQVRINGAHAPATALSEWLSILWLTPAMDRLFAEAPSGRRAFLDRLVLALEPGHARHASRYEAAMRARNRLLAGEGPLDADWCTALEAQMAEHGAPLAAARARTIEALGDVLAAQPEGPFARAALAIEGGAGSDDLAAALARGRDRDRAAGRTLEGPHRSDLAVTHVAKGQAAEYCSTGEQKALLLAIVLAHADLVASRAGRRPILLLDEVAAHLDPLRRAALFQRLSGGGQVWMTGTEEALFAEAGAAATRLDITTTSVGSSIAIR
ncbi:DNA replication/repair protein RecF [Parasphingopyxis marina]|uniref:DNA replication and repair protein RecF n=1 Tax=Parasphingopyxis marina TaxID=2761622 RepID=A0A842HSZ5_9SPHN|nr:DNA replication/repair protein RecF [Parasphingopyxis marina]MBC2776142.1 DNA replication/repair protein RecF [Parasphingopyxis marina]